MDAKDNLGQTSNSWNARQLYMYSMQRKFETKTVWDRESVGVVTHDHVLTDCRQLDTHCALTSIPW